jgi:hypothetical protein
MLPSLGPGAAARPAPISPPSSAGASPHSKPPALQATGTACMSGSGALSPLSPMSRLAQSLQRVPNIISVSPMMIPAVSEAESAPATGGKSRDCSSFGQLPRPRGAAHSGKALTDMMM